MPSTSATAVAPSATRIDVQSASRAPALWAAASHQSSVKPSGGHVNVRDVLNDSTSTITSGV